MIRVVKTRLTKIALLPVTGCVRITGCSARGNLLPSASFSLERPRVVRLAVVDRGQALEICLIGADSVS